MLVVLSHLPDVAGKLEPMGGLGGSNGLGRCGEYLGRSGGGGRKLGLVTITGVLGCDGGEHVGVTKSSNLGDKPMALAGERGGWSGGGLVGLMPGIFTGLDINWVGGWEKFSTHSSIQLITRNFQRKLVFLLSPASQTDAETDC